MSLTMWYFENSAVDKVSRERIIQMRMQSNFMNSMQKFYLILDGYQIQQSDYIGFRVFNHLFRVNEQENAQGMDKSVERVIILVFYYAFPTFKMCKRSITLLSKQA